MKKIDFSFLAENISHFRTLRETAVPQGEPGKKNVLFMISDMPRHGAQRVLCHLANGIAGDCNLYLLYRNIYQDGYQIDERVHKLIMPFFKHDHKFIFSQFYIRQLKRKYKIDVALSFLYVMNTLNVITKTKERVIVSERNNPKLADPRIYPITRVTYTLADHVVFQTREVQSLYNKWVQKHSIILPNPVSVSCPASPRRAPRIVNSARFNPNKNQEMLIRAFALFLPGHPEYTLSIYGSGWLESYLKKIVTELGLEDKVIFHGNVPDIHEQIADASMFVLSSNVEGMPNALLEAMMMGLPCISTACTGSKEIIQDGHNGLLTEPGNAESLAKAMSWMADHPEEAGIMGQNAMKTAAAFRPEIVIGQWRDFLLGD